MEILISLLVKFAPYLLVGLAALFAVYDIRRKGVLAERARWQEKQAQVKAYLAQAMSQDNSVDTQVKEKTDAVKKAEPSSKIDGDKFRF